MRADETEAGGQRGPQHEGGHHQGHHRGGLQGRRGWRGGLGARGATRNGLGGSCGGRGPGWDRGSRPGPRSTPAAPRSLGGGLGTVTTMGCVSVCRWGPSPSALRFRPLKTPAHAPSCWGWHWGGVGGGGQGRGGQPRPPGHMLAPLFGFVLGPCPGALGLLLAVLGGGDHMEC